MLPSPLLLMMRRGLLAAAGVVCFLTIATPASAGPLCGGTSGFYDDFTDDANGICRNFFPGDEAKAFFFNAHPGFEHNLRISVNEVNVAFGLRILSNYRQPGIIPGFPDYNCVVYGFDDQCVEYLTVHPDDPNQEYHPDGGDENVPGTGDYDGPIIWNISWTQQVGTDPIPEIFHEFGDDSDPEYDELMTGLFFSDTLGPFDFACDQDDSNFEGGPPTCNFRFDSEKSVGDPVRISMSDTFSAAQVGQLAAPEPATTALFALIAAGYGVRVRRRRS